MASSQYSLYNVHVNELFEFCLIYEKISGTTNYSYSIETIKQSFLYLRKLTDDDSSVDLHEIIHWTTLINLQAMLKKENLRKNFLRVKQIADQNLGRCGLCILYTYI